VKPLIQAISKIANKIVQMLIFFPSKERWEVSAGPEMSGGKGQLLEGRIYYCQGFSARIVLPLSSRNEYTWQTRS
jgi:hypothetical protein